MRFWLQFSREVSGGQIHLLPSDYVGHIVGKGHQIEERSFFTFIRIPTILSTQLQEA